MTRYKLKLGDKVHRLFCIENFKYVDDNFLSDTEFKGEDAEPDSLLIFKHEFYRASLLREIFGYKEIIRIGKI
jgi:hypothetical protein